MNNKKFYVYTLIDASSNIPFYVGKGCGNRMYDHVSDAKRSNYKNFRSVHAKISKLTRTNTEILYEQIYCDNEQIAFNLETELIKKYGRKDLKTGTLCNLSDGGEGNGNHSEETKQKRIKFHTGRKRPEISIVRMKAAQTARRLHYVESSETREKQRQNKINRGSDSQETKEKRRQSRIQPVLQYTTDGTFIRRFDCAADAAKLMKVQRSTSITNCCIGINLHAHGYLWKYENSKDGILSPSIMRPVYQLDPINSSIIKCWDTLSDAATFAGVNRTQIISCCKGRYKLTAGFGWKYADDKPLKSTNARPIVQYEIGTNRFVKQWASVSEAGTELNINKSGITRCCRGELKSSHGYIWKYNDLADK